MPSSPIVTVALWVAFFGASAYGHVALKIAVDARPSLAATIASPLALSAYFAWAVSAVLWAVVLSKHSLLAANGISALRYAAVAIAAVVFLREPITARHVLGAALSLGGVLLLANKG